MSGRAGDPAPFRRGARAQLTFGTLGEGRSTPLAQASDVTVLSVRRERVGARRRFGQWRIYVSSPTVGVFVSEGDLVAT